MIRSFLAAACLSLLSFTVARAADLGSPLPAVPAKARLVLDEDWAGGKIDVARWYVPRKQWGDDKNNGVTSANVRIEPDTVAGKQKHVLVCQANGDLYDGPVVGKGKRKPRVGGMVVTNDFYASGRYEVVMKVGSTRPHEGGPADPMRPKGTVPAIWTYAYRWVSVPKPQMHDFVPTQPLYNPQMRRYGGAANEYWSELDFPEFGKGGVFEKALYNTFLQNQHEPKTFDVAPAIDGQYHTLTTEWRTKLNPINATDAQVIEHQGFWWVQDKAVPFDQYWGNPLKRVGKDKYVVYVGDRVDHWIDGKKVAENTRFVPAMAAQLTIGIWLPDWAGEARWKTATMSVASVKIWQYDDEGDVRGVLTESLRNAFDENGNPTK